MQYEWTECGLKMLRDIQISIRTAGGIDKLADAIIKENPEYFPEETIKLKRIQKRKDMAKKRGLYRSNQIIEQKKESMEDKVKRLSKSYTPAQISFLVNRPEEVIKKYLNAA